MTGKQPRQILIGLIASAAFTPGYAVAETSLLWGDTHVHTNNSFDAYMFGETTVDPDGAFRFAKGMPVIHPGNGVRYQLRRPLDFMVVADHAENVGIAKAIGAGDKRVVQSSLGAKLYDFFLKNDFMTAFKVWLNALLGGQSSEIAQLANEDVSAEAWTDATQAADRNNRPGEFTALVGWEWTSMPGSMNLHRVVMTDASGEQARSFAPFSSTDSDRPEDLWRWLDVTAGKTGRNFVAIPHNSNSSGGLMFNTVDSDGRSIGQAYARIRARWEPVVEITQTKGDSETRPVLSPNDEFANFEFFPSNIASPLKPTETSGDYVRAALRRGMEIERRVGTNPFKFGVVGSTDTHSGLSSGDEQAFTGKLALEVNPSTQSKHVGPTLARNWDISASGRAAVWARENTREAILEAFRRREVYATTGPRISLRFFGGFGFAAGDERTRDLAALGYAKGVPMGGDLAHAPRGKAPSFLIHAVKDPLDGNLDRVQVVKGWIDAKGKSHEKVFDVSWAGDRRLGVDGKLPAVGNTVDLKTARYTNSIGAAQLATVWSDPEFNARQRAFYYIRVLQIPTPRRSLYDALALGVDPKETGQPATIQERAYSSPIWFNPQ